MARHPTHSSTSCSTTSRPATQCSPTALSTRRTFSGSPTKCLRLQQQTCRIVGAKPQREPRSIPMSHYGPRSLGGYVEPSLTPTVSSSTSAARSDCLPPKPEPPPNCWSPPCTHRGCGIPATLCDVDHRSEWASDGGSTDQANAMPLCGSHDRWKHANSIRSRRSSSGRLFLIRPDGTTVLPVGARQPDWAGPLRYR